MMRMLLVDAFFAAIAGMGFGAISNPPKKALPLAGLLAGAGHAARMFLMDGPIGMHVVPATLTAAFLIGFLGFAIGRINRIPAEVFTFPALLPMIPGKFAYNAIISTISFLQSRDAEQSQRLLIDMFSNGMKATFILLAIVVGASMSVFIDTLSTKRQTRLFFKFKSKKNAG